MSSKFKLRQKRERRRERAKLREDEKRNLAAQNGVAILEELGNKIAPFITALEQLNK
jgi:hypothetical protein